jgi:AraC family transcriptional regulator of adaptative response/methylated-DNA-[protein]-cysteine methyltransferase
MEISYCFIQSPLGMLLIAGTSQGLCYMQFDTSKAELVHDLKVDFADAALEENTAPLSNWIDILRKYFRGNSDVLNIPVEMTGTSFKQSVWQYLRQIPFGQTRTYSDIAVAIGQPGAVRAVASACALNKIAVVIPCHRVVRRDGSLSGYRWGIDRKQSLLQNELLASSKLLAVSL